MKRRESKSKSENETESESTRASKGDQETDPSNERHAPLASLHQSVGNQAAQRLVKGGIIQGKLEVSSPSDPAEREAKKIAERVTEMDASSEQATESEEAQRKPDPDLMPTNTVRRSAAGSEVSEEVESTVKSGIKGAGKPLPETMRSNFESKMGADFSDVRVHTGSAAAEAAQSINAEAYTMGGDIAFAKGNYKPESSSGRELLAHELTHVVQQDPQRTAVQRQEGQQSEQKTGQEDQQSEQKTVSIRGEEVPLEKLESEAKGKFQIGTIVNEFFEWAGENYIIPQTRFLKHKPWHDQGPYHKDDYNLGDLREEQELLFGAGEKIPEKTEGMEWLAFASGLGMTLMVGVEIYVLWGVTEGTVLVVKGVGRAISLGASATGRINDLLGESDIQVKINSGNASRLQLGFFMIYIAGNENVQERFLKQNYSELPNQAKSVVKGLINYISSEKVSSMSE